MSSSNSPTTRFTAIAIKAIERKTGARGLRSILEGILLDTMFDLPSMDGVDEVHIDKDVVVGTQGTGPGLRRQGQDRRRRLSRRRFSLKLRLVPADRSHQLRAEALHQMRVAAVMVGQELHAVAVGWTVR